MRARDKRTATENKRQVLMFSRLGKNSKKPPRGVAVTTSPSVRLRG